MEKPYNLGEIISALKSDAAELLNLKLQLLKLEAVEKASKGASFLVYGIVLVGLASFALLFGFLALGFLFADWLNSLAGGFALVVALYLILAIILLAFRKPILESITNQFIKEMAPEFNEEEENKHKEDNERKEEYYGCR
jgi:Protein of unknown function (DUF1469).